MKKIYIAVVAVIAPSSVLAASVKDFPDFILEVSRIINMIVPVIFGLALLAFLWGVMKYVVASDVKSKADGRAFIIYGIIGLAVMLSVWGLAAFVKNTFFANTASPYTPGPAPCANPNALGPGC